MAELQFKLLQINRRHEQCKAAFQQLKSQIEVSLLEAHDVFTSLSIPLMRLVGLKFDEMAEEGRSSFIFTASEFQTGCRGKVAGFETASQTEKFSGNVTNQIEVESIISKAKSTIKELVEKQKNQFYHLVSLLRTIETLVNCHQDALLQNMEEHRRSVHQTHQKALSHISVGRRRLDYIAAPSEAHDALLCLALKLHHATFERFGLSLGSVEEQILALINELAEQMCAPLVALVKGLKAEVAAGGAAAPLQAAVEEMERLVREKGLELEVLKRRLTVEEEGKLQALKKLRECEEKVARLGKVVEEGRVSEFLGFFERRSREVAMEGYQGHLSAFNLKGFNFKGTPFNLEKNQSPHERDALKKKQHEANPKLVGGFHLPSQGHANLNTNGVEGNKARVKGGKMSNTPSPHQQAMVVSRRPITRSCSRGLSPHILPLKHTSASFRSPKDSRT